MKITRAVLPVLAASALLALTACSSTPTAEEAAIDGCDAFAFYLQKSDGGVQGMDRKTTVEQVSLELDKTEEPVDEVLTTNLGDLERTVDANGDAWEMAADGFVNSCYRLGWEA